MKVKDNKVYFEVNDYDLAKELLNKHIAIHADGTGPFGEDEGAFVSGMDVDYADNIDNYEGLEGKGWDELDDEEQSWFDGEVDFEQLNPYWADGIVCIDKDLGQSGINWCDWEMIYADLWIEKEDYDNVNNVHEVEYDMEVESTKHSINGMLLSEAKEILKKNGYIIEAKQITESYIKGKRSNYKAMDLRELLVAYYAHWTGYDSDGMKCGLSSNPTAQKIDSLIWEYETQIGEWIQTNTKMKKIFAEDIKHMKQYDASSRNEQLTYNWKMLLMNEILKLEEKYKDQIEQISKEKHISPYCRLMIGIKAKMVWPDIVEFVNTTDLIPNI